MYLFIQTKLNYSVVSQKKKKKQTEKKEKQKESEGTREQKCIPQQIRTEQNWKKSWGGQRQNSPGGGGEGGGQRQNSTPI